MTDTLANVMPDTETTPAVTETPDPGDDTWNPNREAEETLQVLYGEPEEADQEPEADDPAPEAPAPAEAAPSPSDDHEPAGAEEEPEWTTSDIKVITALQQAGAEFQQDLQAFAQVKAADIDTLAGGDKGKAAAIRAQIKEAETELRTRYETLHGVASELQNAAQGRQMTRHKRRIKAEQAKLRQEIPDFDKNGLRNWLLGQGYTPEQLAQVTSRDVKLAWKAMKAEKADAAKPERKVVVPKKANAKEQDAEAAPVVDFGDPHGVLRDLYDRGKDGPPSVARGANAFQRQAAADNLYPAEADTGRRTRHPSDDLSTEEILYGPSPSKAAQKRAGNGRFSR